MATKLRIAVTAAAFTFVVPIATAATGPLTGMQVFKRCAACHTASGGGVPGAYPPLTSDARRLARSRAGRRYLVLVVLKGLSGPITVQGKPYRGLMPAQVGLDDRAIAGVLNHVASTLGTGGSTPPAFTPEEVATIRASAGNLNGAAVARLRP